MTGSRHGAGLLGREADPNAGKLRPTVLSGTCCNSCSIADKSKHTRGMHVEGSMGKSNTHRDARSLPRQREAPCTLFGFLLVGAEIMYGKKILSTTTYNMNPTPGTSHSWQDGVRRNVTTHFSPM